MAADNVLTDSFLGMYGKERKVDLKYNSPSREQSTFGMTGGTVGGPPTMQYLQSISWFASDEPRNG